jgi:hypothetical protein
LYHKDMGNSSLWLPLFSITTWSRFPEESRVALQTGVLLSLSPQETQQRCP